MNYNYSVIGIASLLIFPQLQAQANHSEARAQMMGKSGSQAEGSVEFSKTSNGVKVRYDFKKLPENKTLGFHIHEKGDCSATDAKSAGAHFAKHGEMGTGTSSDNPEKHAGDLPSVKTDLTGAAKGSFTVPNLTITETNAIQNRAIILHDGPDDVHKKSAQRIACGVIKTVK